jgi:hypothetical protein
VATPLPIPIKKPSIVQNLRAIGSTLNVNVKPLLVPARRQLSPQDKSDPVAIEWNELPWFHQDTVPPSPNALRAPDWYVEMNGSPDRIVRV